MTENGIIACGSKTARLYASLRLTEGACLFELNKLTDCRKAWEEAQRVSNSQLRKDGPGSMSLNLRVSLLHPLVSVIALLTVSVAAMYNNLGNLELAVGQVERAMENYEHALRIWIKWPKSEMQLAITYLCLGRVYMLQGNYSEALETTNTSDDLVRRSLGTDKGFDAQ